jgi:WD40 repeat protein
MDRDRKGKVITFYSYKGGTGRSMVLANVAWILASGGKQVLVIDWDLEAPGLHRYFAPFLPDPELTSTDGLIEFVRAYEDKAMTREGPREESPEKWYEPFANILRYAISLENYTFPEGGGIDLVPAGRQGPLYAPHVNSFNWQNFYERLGGGAFLELVRRRMAAEYDYILIDSRTGVSDTSGICTVQMPDILAVCFTANNQGIQGAAAVAASVRKQWGAAEPPPERPLRIFPVLCRIDPFEKHKLELRQEYAREEFGLFLDHLSGQQRAGYWGAVEIPYVPYYAYEEILAAFGDRPRRETTLLACLERLTGYLTDGEVNQLREPPTESQRRSFLAWYERAGRDAGASTEAPDVDFDVYLAYRPKDAESAEWLAGQLQGAGLKPWLEQSQVGVGEDRRRAAGDGLQRSASCAVVIGPKGAGERFDEELVRAISRRAGEDRRFRCIPVLLPGAKAAQTPEPLKDYLGVGFSSREDAEALRRLVAGVRGFPPEPTVRPGECPFRGAEYFDVEHAPLFHGREALVEEFFARVPGRREERSVGSRASKRTRLVAISGPSGGGATSFVRAGIVAALARRPADSGGQWSPVILRPGPNPLESLAVALAAAPEISRDPARVRELVRAMGEDRKALHLTLRLALDSFPPERAVLLVVDQFEEVFTACGDAAQRKSFIENLVYAADTVEGRAVLVLACAPGYAEEMQQYPDLAAAVRANSLDLPPLTEEQLRQVIEEPVRLAVERVGTGLADRLIADAKGQPAALALVEQTLAELWGQRAGGVLSLRGYHSLGGLAGVALRSAGAFFKELSWPEREICRRVFRRFSALRGAENVELERVLLVDFGYQSVLDADVPALLRRLARARLLVISAEDSDLRVAAARVGHTALLQDWSWRDDSPPSQADSRLQAALAVAALAWREKGSRDYELLSGTELTRSGSWADEHPGELNRLESEFLKKSTERGESARQRASRTRTSLISAALVIAVIAAPYVGWYNSHSRNETTTAELSDRTRELEKSNTALTENTVQLQDARKNLEDATAKGAKLEGSLQQAQTLLKQKEVDLQSATKKKSELEDQLAESRSQLGQAKISELAATSLFESTPRRRLDLSVAAAQQIAKAPTTSALVEESLRKALDSSGSFRVLTEEGDGLLDALSAICPFRVVTAIPDQGAKFWDLGEKNFAADPLILPLLGDRITAVALSDDGSRAVLGLGSGSARAYDTASAEQLKDFSGDGKPVRRIQVSPDGHWMIASSEALGGRQARARNRGAPAGAARSLPEEWWGSAGGQWLAYGGMAGALVDEVKSIPPPAGPRVYDLSHPDAGPWLVPEGKEFADSFNLGRGGGLAAIGAEGVLLWWLDHATKSGSKVLQKPTQTLTGVRRLTGRPLFSPGGRWLAAAADDGGFGLWDLRSQGGNVEPTLVGLRPGGNPAKQSAPVGKSKQDSAPARNREAPEANGRPEMAFSPDGSWFAAGAGSDGSVRLWDLGKPQQEPTLTLTLDGVSICSFTFSRDGKQMVTGAKDGTVRCWTLADKSNKLKSILLGVGDDEVTTLAAGPDDRLAAGTRRGAIYLWKLNSASVPASRVTLESGDGYPVTAAVFSASGQWLVTSGSDVVRWTVGEDALLALAAARLKALSGPEPRNSPPPATVPPRP